ncbi:MAG: 30S ribosomal protein S1 [Desulfobacterales bacterium]|nr:30S ribosomal protein S1 [Desulfobacterales bacterium]
MARDGFSATENIDSAFADDLEAFPEEDGKELLESEEDIQDSRQFMELFEESLISIQEGKVVKGEIVQIDNDFVLVDIGYKSEGQIRISEFINLEGRLTAKVGDRVDVLLVRKEDKEGRIILSKEKAAGAKIWDDVEEAYKKHETVRGKIISLVKGGLSVDIGLQAFLPGSQADLRPVKDLGALVGTEHDFRVVKYEKKQGNIVLSRRAALETERKALRKKTFKLLEKDAVLEGIVTNIKDYGLFIDLGGIDGLLHITDMSWGRVGHPSELYRIGDEIKVKVLKFDREKERVSLGLKQLNPDPWQKAEEKYPVNTRVEGKVLGLADYGAFVEVEEGIEGLIHVSEMSWTGKIKHPSQILSVGNVVETVVLSLDAAKRRISLGMKQLEPNPWDSIAENYPVGAVIEGRIKNIADFGLFIGINEGIDGLVHISDMSWTEKINHPSELYKKGDEVQAVILEIDTENERFSLGIKQLTPDPWDAIPEKYPIGTRVRGIVKNVTDFGLFVELEAGIEGLIHVSQLPKGQEGGPLKGFHVTDEIEAEIINVSQKDKKIGLSIRKLQESAERAIHKSYVKNQKQATSNLGELLKEKMLDLQPQVSLDNPESELDTEIGPADGPSEQPPSGEMNSF